MSVFIPLSLLFLLSLARVMPVVVIRTFSFRISPSVEQKARLACWEGALRSLWNLAHEQRLLGLSRTDKLFPSWFDQKKELTLLRAEIDWIEDLPANAGQALLARLDDAWKDCFAGKAGKPHFKAKGRNPMSIEEPSKACWRLDTVKGLLRFPKLGNLPITLHQPLEGKAKVCTLVRKVDQWFAHLICEVDVADPQHDHPASVVAIDRGVTVAFADSNDGRVDNPRFGDALAPKLAKRQRQLQKKQKGSKNRAKARENVAKVQRKLHRKREHFLHTWSHRYAKNHGVVVVEKLALKNMTRSARGTLEQPGVNVAAKSGLNRAMADIAMGRFGQLLRYKSQYFGGVVAEVEAAYSSQTCASCGQVDAASRQGIRFRCTACGHGDHADSNAAKVLKQRYEINIRRTGGEAACGGSPVRGGPMKQEPKPARARTQALKKPRAKSPGLQAGDGLRFAVGPCRHRRHPRAHRGDPSLAKREQHGGLLVDG